MIGAAALRRSDKWLVVGVACLPFFFVNFATFISLGIVLTPMVGEMHWSFAEAGVSFSVLGLSCGLTSPLPAMTMKRFGGRFTFCAGAILLLLGFLLASAAYDLLSFYAAMILVGGGFAFVGNVPGVYLISSWFDQGAARLVGFYLMIGALGAACGPPIVETIVRTEGWRGHWRAMAVVSAVLGVICFAFIRDPVTKPAESGPQGGEAADTASTWTVRQAVLSAPFMLLAAAMAFTMTGITTLESIAVPHLTKLGASPQSAAILLSIVAITSTAVKGITGWLGESISATRLVATGLVFQAIGDLMLIFADSGPLQYASALIFGAGWGLCIVAGTVGMLGFFGPAVGSRALSIVSLLVTIGVLGPVAAGLVGDRYATFTPIFVGSIAILLALAIPIFLLPRPVAGRQIETPPMPVALTTEIA